MPGDITTNSQSQKGDSDLVLDLALWSNTPQPVYFTELTGPWEVVLDETYEKEGD